MEHNKLTAEEERIIEHKGTEAPYTGEYESHFTDGIYICRRCNAELYHSKDKFHSGCGWPSFDDEIEGAVERSVDADGRRTEITCSNCGGHLGHVFHGERLTTKNERHCVNSLSMRFVPMEKYLEENQKTLENIVLGGGCFWCIEAVFEMFDWLDMAVSGYSGGEERHANYNKVSMGTTDHAEVVQITFDTTKISLQGVLEIFFTAHDPTSLNKQGGDEGKQYRSVIFYANNEQKKVAKELIVKLESDKVFDKPIVTELVPLEKFYPAEEDHQHYYKQNLAKPYCQVVINPKLKKIRDKYLS